MEYIRATGMHLRLRDLLAADFEPRLFKQTKGEGQPVRNQATALTDEELFNVDELLEFIDEPYWKQTMSDFLRRPPRLIIDTSPTNIRGFKHYPIARYELLKRFITDNYEVESIVDGFIVYRLLL